MDANNKFLNVLLFSLLSLSAAVNALIYKKAGLGYLSLFSLVIPLVLIFRANNYRKVIIYGFLYGFIFFTTLNDWLLELMRFSRIWVLTGWMASSLYLSLFTTGAFLTIKVIHKNTKNTVLALMLISMAWVAFEFLRMIGIFAFPWGVQGYTLIGTIFGKASAIFGWAGLSYLAVSINVFVVLLIISLLQKKNLQAFGLTIFQLIIIIMVILIKGPRLNPHTRVYAAHSNYPSEKKFLPEDNERYIKSLMEESQNQKAEIIVWPESILSNPQGKTLNIKQDLIFGALREDSGNVYNSAFLLEKNKLKKIYDKNELVLIGEYIPFRFISKAIPFLYGSLTAGDKEGIFDVIGKKAGIVICSESASPFLARNIAVEGSQIIIVITNDEWFGDSSLAYQHLQIARLRAIENGKYLVQSANGGYSAVIDPVGNGNYDRNKGVKGFVDFISNKTFYTRTGWIFQYIAVLIIAIYISWHIAVSSWQLIKE